MAVRAIFRCLITEILDKTAWNALSFSRRSGATIVLPQPKFTLRDTERADLCWRSFRAATRLVGARESTNEDRYSPRQMRPDRGQDRCRTCSRHCPPIQGSKALCELTASRCSDTVKPVGVKSGFASLAALLLLGAGICPCLAANAEPLASAAHDCGTESSAPTEDQPGDCATDCRLVATGELYAEFYRAGTPDATELPAPNLSIAQRAAPARTRSIPARSSPGPKPPPYILHSSLVL